jgi:ribosomal protein S27AE
VRTITVYEWACSNCGTVFYAYDDEKAMCPHCGTPAVKCGKISFVVRDQEFESLMEDLIAQECNDGCWAYEEGVTEENVEEVEAVVGECAVAKLRKALHGAGCPVKEARRCPA